MPNLRFKLKFGDFDNLLTVFTPEQEGKTFPFTEGELIIMPLQVLLIESNIDYEIEEATWIASLFFYGEFISDLNAMRCEVKQIEGNKKGTLYGEVDRDNVLIAHLTAEDSSTSPFKQSDKLVIPLRVSNIHQFVDTLIASLFPVGQVVNDTVICTVKEIEGDEDSSVESNYD
jgi:hypothetical protein